MPVHLPTFSLNIVWIEFTVQYIQFFLRLCIGILTFNRLLLSLFLDEKNMLIIKFLIKKTNTPLSIGIFMYDNTRLLVSLVSLVD